MIQKTRNINIIGVASCFGAQDKRCADAPHILRHLHLQEAIEKLGHQVIWGKNIHPSSDLEAAASNTELVLDICKQLARQVNDVVVNKSPFIVIGGDHSCAIGTWSGVHNGLAEKNDFGLIWIDAHMDSHTHETSPSGAIHGMPLATLLGHGDKSFRGILNANQKIQARNLCLVGIRSFEPGEADLLNQMGVKVFYMEDIEAHGLDKTLRMAKEHVTKHSSSYGVSIDLDAIDPKHAPGVGSPEHNGLNGQELSDCLTNMDFTHNFLGLEVAELNSNRDHDDRTAKLAIKIIEAVFKT